MTSALELSPPRITGEGTKSQATRQWCHTLQPMAGRTQTLASLPVPPLSKPSSPPPPLCGFSLLLLFPPLTAGVQCEKISDPQQESRDSPIIANSE